MYIHIFIYLVGTLDNILLRVYTVHILGYITAVDIFLSCSLKKTMTKRVLKNIIPLMLYFIVINARSILPMLYAR